MAQVIRSAQIDEEPVLIRCRRAEPPAAPEAQAPLAAHTAPVHPLPMPAPQLQPERPAEDPRETLDELRRQAMEEGYREGRERGEREAKAALAEQTARLRALAGSLGEALGRTIGGAEDAMVEIAFAAACKVLGEAAASEEGVRAMVREAMRQVHTKEGMVLRVSPADHALVVTANGTLAEGAKLEIAADERVAAGGCLIETSGGTLDARLEVQLRQLLDTLTRARDAQGE